MAKGLVDVMPRRFWAGPLGQHDDDWLTVWAWLNNRSKAAQATSLIAYRVRTRKDEITAMLNYTADRLEMSPDELREKILAKEIAQLKDVDIDDDDFDPESLMS